MLHFLYSTGRHTWRVQSLRVNHPWMFVKISNRREFWSLGLSYEIQLASIEGALKFPGLNLCELIMGQVARTSLRDLSPRVPSTVNEICRISSCTLKCYFTIASSHSFVLHDSSGPFTRGLSFQKIRYSNFYSFVTKTCDEGTHVSTQKQWSIIVLNVFSIVNQNKKWLGQWTRHFFQQTDNTRTKHHLFKILGQFWSFFP